MCQHTQVDVSERATADLPADTVLVAHAKILCTGQYILVSSSISDRSTTAVECYACWGWLHKAVRTIVVMAADDLPRQDFGVVEGCCCPQRRMCSL